MKKEYSYENVLFWIACENYKIASFEQRESLAQQINGQFLSSVCLDPINIDSTARQEVQQALENGEISEETFSNAQKQVRR